MPTIPLTSIIIDRENRQRRELEDIETLAASISQLGLIHPIILDENNILIAGERRLTAHQYLGLPEIEFRRFEELDHITKQQIELEENIQRSDLSWQDEVSAVTRYHQLCLESDPNWTQEQTAEKLGISRGLIYHYQLVEQYKDNSLVTEAPQISTAINAAKRLHSRATADTSRAVSNEIDSVLAPALGYEVSDVASKEETEPKPIPFSILNDDFGAWAEEYTGPKFNFIHCDFPYGVNVGDKVGQSGAKVTGQYKDDFETYTHLLASLTAYGDNFIEPSAHLMFWFSMDYYHMTKHQLEEGGWHVNPFPLIWHKTNNKGILPDYQRGPRRIYETAFLASRGDRLIVQAVSNVIGSPTDNELHQAQKPIPVLHHFFRMLVDTNTTILDPTCGSGNALRAAYYRGAKSGLGIELDPEFAAIAETNIAP